MKPAVSKSLGQYIVSDSRVCGGVMRAHAEGIEVLEKGDETRRILWI